jgi:hypothetical protein
MRKFNIFPVQKQVLDGQDLSAVINSYKSSVRLAKNSASCAMRALMPDGLSAC